MGSGGVAIAALPTVIYLEVPFSDGLGGGEKMSGDTKVMIPDVPKASDSAYMKARKHELFRKRAGIEPVIGHCKSDHRLGRNFYKGLFGDSINVMLAAAAFNFKRAMRLFLCLFRWVIRRLMTEGHCSLITLMLAHARMCEVFKARLYK